MSIPATMQRLGVQARAAATLLAVASEETKNRALEAAAAAVRDRRACILEANEADMSAAHELALSAPLCDRLRLDDERVENMAAGLVEIARLADPVGRLLGERRRPNGMLIQQVAVPLGVVGVIYESRPNVTADAGALCLKSGNAAILRGGSESARTAKIIHECLAEGLRAAALPAAAVQLVPTQDRAAVDYLLGEMRGSVDVIVPRGGKELISRVRERARVPVIGHLDGVCHVYVDGSADLQMAVRIAVNAKMRRTGICGAAETLLVDRACAGTHLAPLIRALIDAGCEVRGDAQCVATDARVLPAQEQDWYAEYLDAIIAVRVIDGVEAAIAHITTYGSQHTDCIIAADAGIADRFLCAVDSAIVLHNASTQFADGAQFGMGAEIGISTEKFHARGPVGVEQLMSYKYVVRGSGQIRP